jgi:predicted AlkP superfamily phosphohydrolase/phosphomutase
MNKKFITIIPVVFSILILISISWDYKYNKEVTWPENSSEHKVVILGFDGMETSLFEKWLNEGKLPNIKSISDTGTYSKLATTFPAQSPVAWSSFATGTNPGKHDVMDFIIRDPKTYTPSIGMIDINQKIGKPEIINRQKGETFWEILSNNGLKSKIIKVPITFPPEPVNGQIITGLGTPDALGTIGTFGYYTTEDTEYIDNDQAYRLVKLEQKDIIKTNISGPKKTSVKLDIKRNENSVELSVGKQKINLNEGEWSEYVNIDFNLIGPFYKNHGIARFYLEEAKPDLKLYLSPISFNPEKPLYNISYPSNYAKDLSKEVGLFKTIGFGVDVWALKEERISEDVFLQDLDHSLNEELKILKQELSKNDWNSYVQVFQATDLAQHMFYRYIDPLSPRYENGSKYENTILEVYQKMDDVVAEVKKIVPKDTTIIIMSDHGFKPYRRSVDLNSWLYENGYLALKDPSKRSDYLNNLADKENFWSNIDWANTKAYGLGLGSIYINLDGREGEGIVNDNDYINIREEIKSKLLALKDGNNTVISNVYKREDIMHGDYTTNAADLIVGFKEGYRVSWQTTFGTVPTKTIFDNNNKFSGDHCSVDPKIIPGIFVSNKKIDTNNLSIIDIAPMVLNEFGISKPQQMDSTKY